MPAYSPPFQENMNHNRLKDFLGRALKVREGEWRPLITMAVMFFLLFTCLIYGRSIRTALFLQTFGIERLPEMYLFTYAILAVVSTAYSALVDRLDKARLLSASSIFFCILFLFQDFLSHIRRTLYLCLRQLRCRPYSPSYSFGPLRIPNIR